MTRVIILLFADTICVRTRGAASRARGAARTRVIWRRQVIDSPSGDNAQPPTSLIVPRDGYRSNSVYFKGDRGRSGLERPLDDGFSVTRTDPRRPTRLIDIRRFTPTNARATPTRRWAATKNHHRSFFLADAGNRLRPTSKESTRKSSKRTVEMA